MTRQRKCSYCDGTGKFKKPNNDEEYSRRYDWYENKAYHITSGEAREKALSDVVYTLIDCPYCAESGDESE